MTETITINLDNQTSMDVEATIIDNIFGVHRMLKWDTSMGEHAQSDTLWSVTHLKSGRRVDGIGRELTSKHQAVTLAKKLVEANKAIFDFTSMNDLSVERLADIKTLVNYTFRVATKEAEKKSSRFVVRRADKGYDVIDTASGVAVATKPHRGMAAIEAGRLNEEDV